LQKKSFPIVNLLGALIGDDINWDRAGDKIDSFVKWSESELLRRRNKWNSEGNESGGQNSFFRTIAKYHVVWWNLSFIMAYVINILIIIGTDRVILKFFVGKSFSRIFFRIWLKLIFSTENCRR
jgi:hypothetical protein